MALETRVVIVGGGLSGLVAASLLEARGVADHVLLEARSTFGGRIRSEAWPGGGRFDLGATWYWPALQPGFARLVDELSLTPFVQPERGDMLVERPASASPARVRGYPASPAAMRIVGGMGAVVDALQRRVPAGRLHAGMQVTHIRRQAASVEVEAVDRAGKASTWRAHCALLALPPRLAASTIAFEPELPPALAGEWHSTATWMAPHAKYLAVYDTPFWRDQGLSGEARSGVGPLAEIHDASSPGGKGALFGFIGIPARARAAMPEDALRARCREQLVRLFGPAAAAPSAEWLKDWAADECTATAADGEPEPQHARPPAVGAASGPWQGRILGVASEWSREFPGYAAGAVDAARAGVDLLAGSAHGD